MRRVPKRSRLKLANLGEETTYGRVPNVNEGTTAIMIIINGLRLHVPSDREPRYEQHGNYGRADLLQRFMRL